VEKNMSHRHSQVGKLAKTLGEVILVLLLLVGVILCVQPVTAQPSSMPNLSTQKKGPSGLPVPRFVSLKASEVNVRRGPSWDHAVMWVFRRVGLPVEVIAEFDVWRQVRDSEGATGWVLGTLLSGRRTVLVAPWKKGQGTFDMHSTIEGGQVEAKLSPAVLGSVEMCDGKQCKITAGGVSGYISQELLWGVYVGEKIN
jgi:SH3-like domain-containing protein